MAPADCVVHCAGKSADWGKAQEFFDANVIGTCSVVRACEHHGIRRVVFISTPSLYFTGNDRLDIRESDPLPARQLTHYARTKLQAEKELLAFADRGYQVIILRPRAVFGPGDTTITPRILSLSKKRSFPLVNGGEALTDITYVSNLVAAVRSALHAKGGTWSPVYNISNGEPIRIRDWFAGVLDAFGRPFRPRHVPALAARSAAAVMELACRLPFAPKQPQFTRFSVGYMAVSMTMSIERAREHLGYTPEVGNQKGFEMLSAWYRSEKQDNEP
jgi:nucleoside-diphosphate-sugar epimerase